MTPNFLVRNLLIWTLWAFIASAATDPDIPSAAPGVNGIFPHGAQRGSTTVVRLTGQNLHDAKSVEFAGKGLRAEILSSLGTALKLRVTIDPETEVGLHDFRLLTDRGTYVGVFDVGALPEILEVEDNDDWRKPQLITLPVLVNGTIRSEDWDHFQFHAAAGETLVFDVSATRHGSRLDADLAILDRKGNEIAWVDDTSIFGDPHIEHTFADAGDYILRVGSLAGSANADYRLSAGSLPYVSRTFPAGLGSGRTSTLTLTGAQMDLVDEVWIGDRAARGEILHRDANRLDVRFRLAKGLAAGPYRIHASHHRQEIALPTEIRVSDLPELTVAKPRLDILSALAIQPSVVLNGIIEQPKSSHYFRFDGKAGSHYLFHAESMKLGYHLDPTLTILDSGGNKLAFADDPGIDDRSDEYQLDPDLSFVAEKSGTHYLAIRDGMYRGGEQLLYRVTVEQKAPDFIVELREPVKSLYFGQHDTLQVRIRRRAGWTAPVEVWAEGLPGGITVEHQTAQAKDSVVKDTCGVDRVVDGTIITLPIRVDGSSPGRFEFRVKARGFMDGAVVEHQASVHYQHLTSGYIYGPMQVQKAELTVTPPPAIVWNSIDRLSVKLGGSQPLKVTIRRFGQAKDTDLSIRARKAPAGISVESSQIPAASKTGTLIVKAEPNASAGPVILEAVNSSGAVLGESAPFLLETGEAPVGK